MTAEHFHAAQHRSITTETHDNIRLSRRSIAAVLRQFEFGAVVDRHPEVDLEISAPPRHHLCMDPSLVTFVVRDENETDRTHSVTRARIRGRDRMHQEFDIAVGAGDR